MTKPQARWLALARYRADRSAATAIREFAISRAVDAPHRCALLSLAEEHDRKADERLLHEPWILEFLY
jgi:hypothetical protein